MSPIEVKRLLIIFQGENASLLRDVQIHSNRSINTSTYGTIPNHLEQNFEQNSELQQSAVEEITAIPEISPEMPSPATLNEETKDEKYDLEKDPIDDDEDSKLIRNIKPKNHFIVRQEDNQESPNSFVP